MNLVCWACHKVGHMEDVCPKIFKDKQLQKQATPYVCKQDVEADTREVTEPLEPALSGHASERRRDVLQTGVIGRIVTGTVAKEKEEQREAESLNQDKEALVSALQAARHNYEVLWQDLVKERECWKKEQESNNKVREANAELQRCILPALQEHEALKKTESLLQSELEEVTTSLEKANTVIVTMDEKQIKGLMQ
ncbi:hypothetical protein FKM82_010696 [Ascaphus truei]